MSDVIFNGVILDPNLIWADRYNFTPVAQSTHRTLSGNLVIFPAILIEGQVITLEATENTGWFTGAMVTSMKSFANVVGASYVLDFHGEIHNVVFNHEIDPVVSFTGLRPIEPQGVTDPFTGILNLLTI